MLEYDIPKNTSNICNGMPKGTVKWFNDKKGFGFILDPEIDEDIFVHYSVIQGEGFKTLATGDNVEFDVVADDKGKKARNVIKIE